MVGVVAFLMFIFRFVQRICHFYRNIDNRGDNAYYFNDCI